jgi:hypothetical protein
LENLQPGEYFFPVVGECNVAQYYKTKKAALKAAKQISQSWKQDKEMKQFFTHFKAEVGELVNQ